MTNKDKTGDQLVASMRKTKSGAVTRKTAARRSTRKPAKPAASRPAPARPAKAISTTAAEAEAVPQDGYSAGRRVWPD